MNDAKKLLLKTRKNATSAFGPKQWAIVLEALGFTVHITKERNSVVAFEATKGQGATVTVKKDPRYRAITFYSLVSDLKAAGYDLVEMSSAALGLDTPEKEKELKELYVRDLTNTGTCPVCSGNFKRNSPGLVHHGYTRPGTGFIHGDCFGVGYLPWELSPQGAQDYVAQVLKPHLESSRTYLNSLKTGAVVVLFKTVSKYINGMHENQKVAVTREENEYEYEQLLRSAIYNTEREVRWGEETVARFETSIANWKSDELPEVKHAGKFRVA
jgi:hypothetical protein